MGNQGSKGKKSKSSKKSKGKKSKPKGELTVPVDPEQNGEQVEAGSSSGADQIDPSWNDTYLFSGKGDKVGKDDFELKAVVGRGSFGKVMQVVKKDTGQLFAMKVLRKEAIIARKQVLHTRSEKSILAKINHPYIITLHYAFQTDTKLYMILDYINGGELFFHLKKEGKFSLERVRLYSAEIVLALSHLHTFGIVYRDLKPENVLIGGDGHIVITDFGLSKELGEDEDGTQTFCGTPEYLAPEVLKGQVYGVGVDWWSLGTLMFEMLTGLPPFYSQNLNIMYQKIISGKLEFPSFIDEDTQSLLKGLLTRDPAKRLDTKKIKSHEFYASIDWERLYDKDITPPYIPDVKDEGDIDFIDPVFTAEAAVDSLIEENPLTAGADDEEHFPGFTYEADCELAA